MSSDLSRLALQTMISRTESARETQGEVDSIYENLYNAITTEMENSIPVFDTSKVSRKCFKSIKPFWNNELKNLWNIMHAKEKQSLQFNGHASTKRLLRTEFLTSQKQFDRKLRQEESNYRQSICSDIENMTTENPNEFWEKIKKFGKRKSVEIPMEVYDQNGELLTDHNIVLEIWRRDFEHLYNNEANALFNSDIHRHALSHKLLLEDRMLDPLYESNHDLNHNITLIEIQRLVMNAKNGKSAGIDNIHMKF